MNTSDYDAPMLRGTQISVLLFLIPLLPAFAQTPSSTERSPSCRKVAQSFFDWYVVANQGPQSPGGEALILRNKRDVFAPQLYQLIKADYEAQENTDEIVSLDVDPVFGNQDPSERFVIEKVVLTNEQCSVELYGVDKGKKREKIVAELIRTNTGWRFANFKFQGEGTTAWDLTSQLKTLAKERAIWTTPPAPR